MGKDQYLQNEADRNTLNDETIAYENLETSRRKQSILLSDTEKFKMFTKLMRISIMLKNAKVTHKKMIE